MEKKDHKRNAVLMNAGAALYIGGKAESMEDGIESCGSMLIDSGKALADVEETDRSQQPAGGRGMTILRPACRAMQEKRVNEAKREVSLEEVRQAGIIHCQKGSFAFETALKKTAFLLSVNARRRLLQRD